MVKHGQTQAITHITLLLLPESSLMTLASVLDPLRAANRFSRRPLFSWRIASFDGAPVPLTCGIDIPVDGAFDERAQGDTLIIIAGFRYHRHATPKGLQALRRVRARFDRIFAIEAGTWILAQAGLITHQAVTTHWEDTENLSEVYPHLDVRRDRYVIDDPVWSCGGASPAMDMMLHYIRTFANKSLALDVASAFIYSETDAPTRSQPIVSVGSIEKTEPRLSKAIQIMEQTIENPLPTKAIAERVDLSVRQLETLSQDYLGTSPGAYYLRLRLQTARRLVLDTNLSIQYIAVRCGFNSQSAFSRAFKRRYSYNARTLRAQRYTP